MSDQPSRTPLRSSRAGRMGIDLVIVLLGFSAATILHTMFEPYCTALIGYLSPPVAWATAMVMIAVSSRVKQLKSPL